MIRKEGSGCPRHLRDAQSQASHYTHHYKGFSPFPTMFSNLSKPVISTYSIFHLLSVEAFNLDKTKMFSFDKGLTHYHTLPHFDALKIYNCRKQ